MAYDPRRNLLHILESALAAVHGRVRVREHLEHERFDAPVCLIAVGKAACAMAQGAHDALGARIVTGLVVTKHGHAEPLPWPVIEAGHPLPDAASLAAGERLASFVSDIPQTATVLVLLSGGASALLELLPEGMTLADLQRLNAWLLGSGLDIHAMNAVRKRLSCIKGGRLAQRLHPRRVLCLAISDVPGDDPASIGSGPLTPDRVALDASRLPEFVHAWLALAPPRPLPEDACFQRLRYIIVARNADARAAAAHAATESGWRVNNAPEPIYGDAAMTGARLARELLAAAPGTVYVWGGETTVVLPDSPGRGGRCQTLALAAAQVFAGRDDVWLLAAGSDGSDGPGDEAGALVDGGTLARGAGEGFDAAAALSAADAGSFLEASGDLVQTGPTGTNVMDLVLGLRLPV
jgi:hydroxypyruvate reductase